jgi:hypothetical protein
MARLVVLYDACVLYPAPLRDLLVQLATTRLFQARWTNQIHDEWIRNLAANRSDIADRLNRTRELMNKAVLDCLIDDYQELIDIYPDPRTPGIAANCRADEAIRPPAVSLTVARIADPVLILHSSF